VSSDGGVVRQGEMHAYPYSAGPPKILLPLNQRAAGAHEPRYPLPRAGITRYVSIPLDEIPRICLRPDRVCQRPDGPPQKKRRRRSEASRSEFCHVLFDFILANHDALPKIVTSAQSVVDL